MSELRGILAAIEQGDTHAAAQLLPLVYDELRQLAARKLTHEKPGQTFEATALVHEAYVRLVDGEQAQKWDSRGHFFAAAAEVAPHPRRVRPLQAIFIEALEKEDAAERAAFWRGNQRAFGPRQRRENESGGWSL